MLCAGPGRKPEVPALPVCVFRVVCGGVSQVSCVGFGLRSTAWRTGSDPASALNRGRILAVRGCEARDVHGGARLPGAVTSSAQADFEPQSGLPQPSTRSMGRFRQLVMAEV